MKKIINVTIVTLSIFICFKIHNCAACIECVMEGRLPDQFSMADVVFVGDVVENRIEDDGNFFKFKVGINLKNTNQPFMDVKTPPTAPCKCSYMFEKGQRYLVFAHGNTSKGYITDGGKWTKLFSDAIGYLNEFHDIENYEKVKEYIEKAVLLDPNNIDSQMDLRLLWEAFQPSSEVWIFQFGDTQGKKRTFFKNGKIKYEGNYAQGKLEGVQKTYDENGVLRYESYYKQGKLEGTQKYYFVDGKLNRKICCYKDGRLSGYRKGFSNEGKLRSEELYDNNFLKRHIFYGKNGTISGEGTFEPERSLWKFYSENGNIQKKRECATGRCITREYTRDGHLWIEEAYNDDENYKMIYRKYYDKEGKLKKTVTENE